MYMPPVRKAASGCAGTKPRKIGSQKVKHIAQLFSIRHTAQSPRQECARRSHGKDSTWLTVRRGGARDWRTQRLCSTVF
jgi:hypothetical protein